MCGITGFWDYKRYHSASQGLPILQAMTDALYTRGPDEGGIWVEETSNLYLGHRRLSIIDLSEAGAQPMMSSSQNSVLTYNGEVFNFAEIRQKLLELGVQFKSHSDTEVILEACEHFGVANTCQQLIGMFAFAFWDRRSKKLYLVRDRLGKKPLYWGIHQGILFFASQPKSFKAHPQFTPSINQEALTSFLRYNYVPAPLSMFKDIQKLSPATILTIDEHGTCKEEKFWDFEKIASNSTQKNTMNDKEYTDALDNLLSDAVSKRMISDVPLGAFLSGGIDSSTVVAMMQKQSSTPIKTFTIGFNEENFNEAVYAKAVAKHLGTDHHELYLASAQARDIIPSIPEWCDEPFADVSQIPTFLVSRLARQSVTVALSGDGGDELFAGYNRYTQGLMIWQKCQFLPIWLRSIIASQMRMLSPKHWEKMAKFIPERLRPLQFGDRMYKLAAVLSSKTPMSFYKMLISQWENPQDFILNGKEPLLYPWTLNDNGFLDALPFLEQMQFMDTLTYLPDDILTKVDRASMAVSLEARVPLLDHRVVEFSWNLPHNLKIRGGQSKWLLRQVLMQYIPKSLIERPKMGFGVPIDLWLRGPLKEWANELLSESRLKRDGLLNAPLIRTRLEEHYSGSRNWQYGLWGLLMLEAWRSYWRV